MGILSLPAWLGANWDYGTPRSEILRTILRSYPSVRPENVHVWTLGGDSRVDRMGELWAEWERAGAHLIDENWRLPTGMKAFINSGSYAPMYCVGDFRDLGGDNHLFLVDGYAASAEAVQAATLDSALKLRTSLCLFSTKFKLPCRREACAMRLDPKAPDFVQTIGRIAEKSVSASLVESYRDSPRQLRDAYLPMDRSTFSASDLFTDGAFRSVAISSAIRMDPYSGMPGVETIDSESRMFRVTTRIASETGVRNAAFTFRLRNPVDAARPLSCPLLDRLCSVEHARLPELTKSQAVRIRDELEMTYYEAIRASPNGGLSLDLSRIDKRVLPLAKRQSLELVLHGYKRDLPEAFRWLELA